MNKWKIISARSSSERERNVEASPTTTFSPSSTLVRKALFIQIFFASVSSVLRLWIFTEVLSPLPSLRGEIIERESVWRAKHGKLGDDKTRKKGKKSINSYETEEGILRDGLTIGWGWGGGGAESSIRSNWTFFCAVFRGIRTTSELMFSRSSRPGSRHHKQSNKSFYDNYCDNNDCPTRVGAKVAGRLSDGCTPHGAGNLNKLKFARAQWHEPQRTRSDILIKLRVINPIYPRCRRNSPLLKPVDLSRRTFIVCTRPNSSNISRSRASSMDRGTCPTNILM